MSLTTVTTVTDILNRVAAETGKKPVADPFASEDADFVQMRYLLTTAGEELVMAYPWEALIREHQITTGAADSGVYSLPSDFGYMINQTAWERSENVPIGGPLSAEDWTYLKGRDLAQNTLYASFRIAQGSFNIYPSPPPAGLDLNFEYISKNWVSDGNVSPTYSDTISAGTDKPQFDRTLITRYVKVKFLESKGFDTTKAQDDLNQAFSFLTGQEKGAPVLNAGLRPGVFPYLSIANIPDTGFGM